jgi:hypothetical protein
MSYYSLIRENFNLSFITTNEAVISYVSEEFVNQKEDLRLGRERKPPAGPQIY